MKNIDITFVLDLIFEAGNLINERFVTYLDGDPPLDKKLKLDRTSKVDLTVVPDREVHEKVFDVLRVKYPKDIFISEEFYPNEQKEEYSKHISNDTYFWILDPIDGSQEFAYKNTEFALSLGVFDNQKNPILGIIYNPIENFFVYMFEQKVFLLQYNEFTLVEPQQKLKKDNYNILVSISEYNRGIFDSLGEKKIHLKPVGSIAYKLGLLVVQQQDLVLSQRAKNIWDIAGGIATGSPFFGKELINPIDRSTFSIDPNKSLYNCGLLWGSKSLVNNFF